MENALNRFLRSRNITPRALEQKSVLYNRNGKLMNLNYINILLMKDDAGISEENIERLDKEFKLTEAEKKDLVAMVKFLRRTSNLGVEQMEEKIRQKKRGLMLRDFNHTLSACKEARELIAELQKKSEEFNLLLCVNWEEHAKRNTLSPAQALNAFIKSFAENRTSAAETQKKLLYILGNFERIVTKGLEDEIETFGKIPSPFQMFKSDDFRKETDQVAHHAIVNIHLLINKAVKDRDADFLAWVSTEAKNNSGVVDTKKYHVKKNLFDVEALFSAISFTDLSYAKTGMPFMGMGQMTLMKFFGIEEIVNIIEESVSKKISALQEVPVLAS